MPHGEAEVYTPTFAAKPCTAAAAASCTRGADALSDVEWCAGGRLGRCERLHNATLRARCHPKVTLGRRPSIRPRQHSRVNHGAAWARPESALRIAERAVGPQQQPPSRVTRTSSAPRRLSTPKPQPHTTNQPLGQRAAKTRPGNTRERNTFLSTLCSDGLAARGPIASSSTLQLRSVRRLLLCTVSCGPIVH